MADKDWKKKFQEHWAGSEKALQAQVERAERQAKKNLLNAMEAEAKRLEQQIEGYYKKYADRDGIIEYRKLMIGADAATRKQIFEDWSGFAEMHPEYAHLTPARESIYRLNRLQAEQEQIRLALAEYGIKDSERVLKYVGKTAEQSFTAYCNALGQQGRLGVYNPHIVVHFKPVDAMESHEILDELAAMMAHGDKTVTLPTDIPGKILESKMKLADYMNTNMVNAFARGDSTERIVKDMMTKFKGFTKNDLTRLTYTENTRVMAETSACLNELSGVTEYKFSTYNDNLVCPICMSLQDAGPFKYKDRVPGENFPPMHPWCRCTVTPVIGSFDDFMDSQLGKYLKGFKS